MEQLGQLLAQVVGLWHDKTKDRPFGLDVGVEIHDNILFLRMVETRRTGPRIGGTKAILLSEVLMDAGSKLIERNLNQLLAEIESVEGGA